MSSPNFDFEKDGKYYKYINKNNKSCNYEVIKCECSKWIKKSNFRVHSSSKYHQYYEKTAKNHHLSAKEDENKQLKREIQALTDELKQARKTLKELQDKYEGEKPLNCIQLQNTPIKLVKDIGQTLLIQQEMITSWDSAPFDSINKLKADHSGKVGELFMHKLCQQSENLCSHYCEDQNSKDGTYDIIINDKKIEIKTARLGKQGSFQHENLHLDGYDDLIFMDITPHYYYITILPKFDLDSKCKILGRKAHLRKNTSNVYKFDYTEKNIKNAIHTGFSMKVDSSTTFECLSEFVKMRL